MSQILTHPSEIFKLNITKKSRVYTAEISTKIIQNKKTIYSNIAEEFILSFVRKEDGLFVYRKEVQKRFFLNEINFILKKPNKVQELALKIAAINDNLELLVNKHFQIVKIINTDEIRKKWEEIKKNILKQYSDISDIANDFDTLLKEKNIQRIFLEDNFLNLLFSNLFHKEMSTKKATIEKRIITNGIGAINVPIIEKRKLIKRKKLFSNLIKIEMSAELDTENKKFPLAKMNAFIGKLNTVNRSEHKLHFKYKGNYNIDPDLGLVDEAELIYTFDIPNLYKKISTFNLKLED